jgi:hypothetical protein
MIEPPRRSIALSKARSRARLEKQRRQNGIRRYSLASADTVLELSVSQLVQIGLGDIEHAFDLAVRQIVDGDEVAG